jgi:tRNA (guanine-N7-)-methyltransferase
VSKPKRLTREELAPYQIDLPAAYPFRDPATPVPPAVPLDWAALFGNAHPVEIEVGFGKGLFLRTEGERRPGTNFFGIEIVRKYQLYATTRIAVKALPNVKTTCADAKAVFRGYVVPHTVEAVHVYYPDPWWKTKHKKRLLFTEEFAALIRQVLRPGGSLFFVSDVKDYFDMVTGMLATMPAFTETDRPADPVPTHDMDYLTNFERKFRQEGRPIHRATFRVG